MVWTGWSAAGAGETARRESPSVDPSGVGHRALISRSACRAVRAERDLPICPHRGSTGDRFDLCCREASGRRRRASGRVASGHAGSDVRQASCGVREPFPSVRSMVVPEWCFSPSGRVHVATRSGVIVSPQPPSWTA